MKNSIGKEMKSRIVDTFANVPVGCRRRKAAAYHLECRTAFAGRYEKEKRKKAVSVRQPSEA